MTDPIQNGFGADAIDQEAIYRALQGSYIASGCTPSKGANALEVDIASGVANVDGTELSISAQTVTLTSGDASDPRKDLIYFDSSGTAQVAQGTPAPAQPTGETRRDTYQPQPVDLSGTVGVVVGEVWVPAGASDIVAGDISDRRPVVDGIGGGVPSGSILIWSGTTSDIPAGWTLCDGTDGTPDLRDRFVTGAGGQYAAGATGGADSVQLTEAELPSHTHDHHYYQDRQQAVNSDSGNNTFGDDTGRVDSVVGDGGLVESVGSDQSHENRPPYYALAYIMKV